MVFTETDNRREQWVWGGWYVGPDDVARPREPDPLSSAQARRFWAQLPETDCAQSEFHGAAVPDQRA